MLRAFGGEPIPPAPVGDPARLLNHNIEADRPLMPGEPGAHLIHVALARIHLDEGRFDDAAREIGRELAIAPDSAEARSVGAEIDAARKK